MRNNPVTRFMWQHWDGQPRSTHTDSGCSRTWGRCRWDQQWARWAGTPRSEAPAPGPWQSQTACTPSAPPCQSSAWWWWLLQAHTPPVLRVTASGLHVQRGICTSPAQKEALIACNTNIKLDLHQPCNACLGLDQLLFSPLSSPLLSHVTFFLLPWWEAQSEYLVISWLMRHRRTFSFSLKGLSRFTPVPVQVTESAHYYFEEESHHKRHKWCHQSNLYYRSWRRPHWTD